MIWRNLSARIKSGLLHRRYHRYVQQSAYHQILSRMPPELYPHWQKVAQHEFTGIPKDLYFFIQAAEGLMTFFDCVRTTDRACGLPSKAADSIWHAWLSLPQTYFKAQDVDSFCREYFGEVIPHVAAEQMDVGITDALAVTLIQLRKIADKDPLSGYVPPLFTLDRRLKMPRGFCYRSDGQRLGFQTMSLLGTGSGTMTFPSSFAPDTLLALELITPLMLTQYQVQQERRIQFSNAKSTGSYDTTSIDGSSDVLIGDADADGNANNAVESCSDNSATSEGSSCGSTCGSSCSSS